jgi:hypothetical protein
MESAVHEGLFRTTAPEMTLFIVGALPCFGVH